MRKPSLRGKLVPYNIFGPRATTNGLFFNIEYIETDEPTLGLSRQFLAYIQDHTQCNICRTQIHSLDAHSQTQCKWSPRESRGEPDDHWLRWYVPPQLSEEFIRELKKEKHRNHQKGRRRLLKNAGGQHSSTEKRKLLDLQENRCYYCYVELLSNSPKTRGNLDHFIAVNSGGSNDIRNLVYACGSCNSQKEAGDGTAFLWRKAKTLPTGTKTLLKAMHIVVNKWKDM